MSTLSRTCNDGRYIYFINKGVTYKNKTLQVFKLDITDMTMQRIDITNNTQTNWYNDGGIDAYNEYIYISDSNKNCTRSIPKIRQMCMNMKQKWIIYI